MKKYMVTMAATTFISLEVEADTKVEAVRKAREGEYLDWSYDDSLEFRDFWFPTNKAIVSCLDGEYDCPEPVSIDYD